MTDNLIDMEEDETPELLVGLRGNTQMLLNGYIYSQKNCNKNVTYWKCAQRHKFKCNATLRTSNSNWLTNRKLFNNHSHPPEGMTKEFMELRLKLREVTLTGTAKPQEIFHKVFPNGIPPEVQKSFCKKDTIRRDLNKLKTLDSSRQQKILDQIDHYKKLSKYTKQNTKTSNVDNHDLFSNSTNDHTDNTSVNTNPEEAFESFFSPLFADHQRQQSNNDDKQTKNTDVPIQQALQSVVSGKSANMFEFQEVKMEPYPETGLEPEIGVDNEFDICHNKEDLCDPKFMPALESTALESCCMEDVPGPQEEVDVPPTTTFADHCPSPDLVVTSASELREPLHQAVISDHLNDEIHKLNAAVAKLGIISKELQVSKVPEDELDLFGKYLVSLLRGLPEKTIRSLQKKFVNQVFTAKRIKDNQESRINNASLSKQSQTKWTGDSVFDIDIEPGPGMAELKAEFNNIRDPQQEPLGSGSTGDCSVANLPPSTPSVANLPPSTLSVANLPASTSSVANLPPLTLSVANLPPLTPSVSNLPPSTPSIAKIPPSTPSVANLPPSTPSVANKLPSSGSSLDFCPGNAEPVTSLKRKDISSEQESFRNKLLCPTPELASEIRTATKQIQTLPENPEIPEPSKVTFSTWVNDNMCSKT